MEPRKLNVGFAFFPYGGNGSTSSETPDIRSWLVPTVLKAKEDKRIGDVFWENFSDTPITMTRNLSVAWAKSVGADVLVMVDSDMSPDLYLGTNVPAKPFFETSFDHLYKHWEKGPVLLFAPYCGPPGHPTKGGCENVYVFLWEGFHTGHMDLGYKLEAYTRHEAARMTGIVEAAAGPTGLCMIDVRLFDVIGKPYFDYEWKDDGAVCQACLQPIPGPREEKASTEDVYFFRNICFNAIEKLGYNPILCNWDAWAGHWKPWCVGKASELTADRIHRQLRIACEANRPGNTEIQHVRPEGKMAELIAKAEVIADPTAKKKPENGYAQNGKKLKAPEHAAHNTNDEDLTVLRNIVGNEGVLSALRNETLRIVEIGSWVGNSALAMIAACEDVKTDYQMYCIDHWKGGSEDQRKYAADHDVFAEFRKNLGDLVGVKVFPMNMPSTPIPSAFKATDFDVLFIDGDHSYEGCLADIVQWGERVKPGGIICGHDYSSVFPGVKRAVHEVFGYEVAVNGTVWCVRKPDATWQRQQEKRLQNSAPKSKRRRRG